MLEWSDLRYFLAIWRTGSLSGAARQLGVAQTTVGRRLDALEASLDARLFQRTKAGFVVTEVGIEILEHAQAVEHAALALERGLEGRDREVRGCLRITCTEPFAAGHLVPLLGELHRTHPTISFELLVGYRQASLERREADVAIRLVRPTGDALVARKIGCIELGLYGTPALLERFGTPSPRQGFAGHRVVGYAAELQQTLEARWLEQHASQAEVIMRVNGLHALLAAALAGFGLVLLPRFMAADVGGLREVGGFELPRRDVWLVFHRDLKRNAKVSALAAALVQAAGRLQR